MCTTVELVEYADEIRKQVCSRCIERPAGGPPCAPLGKQCGVELHLPALLDSNHNVQDSEMLAPYLDHNRQGICENCVFLHSSIFSFPMDCLPASTVVAVPTLDQV